MTEYQPTPQHPEEVANGLRDAFRQAIKDGVMDATPYLKQMTYKEESMTKEQEIPYVNISTDNKFAIHQPKYSNYKCYMFGNRPDVNTGIVYIPAEGRVPNRFVRFMMRICFDCLWVENK